MWLRKWLAVPLRNFGYAPSYKIKFFFQEFSWYISAKIAESQAVAKSPLSVGCLITVFGLHRNPQPLIRQRFAAKQAKILITVITL
jgi:hypothetical protein